MHSYMIWALVAVGLYLLNKQSTSSPVFVDSNGNALGTNIPVGTTVSLTVPGYTNVWLLQTKNGVQSYNGLFAVPSPLYTLLPADAGTYTNTAYEVGLNGQSAGNLIGSVQSVVA